MHFTHFDLGFGFSWNIWGFWKLMSILWNFWVGYCVFDVICSCILLHLHFHNVSCIIDVCLYVETYVLLGLDGAEPMLQVYFCTSHVHALLMHIYLFFSIYGTLYWCCFSVCLPLSLSILCMAPKRKTTSSQNPFHSRASSSDPTPLHVRFHEEKARTNFSKNFSWRGVHSERHIVLSDFSDTALPTVIHSRGWESLCEILMTCPIVIIQKFYSNMHGFDTSIPQFTM